MAVITAKAFVILDGTPLRIDRVGMGSRRDRPYYSGRHKAHGKTVQVIADRPAGWCGLHPHFRALGTTWAPRATTASSTP
ncbi:hypothetical protein SAMN05216377_12535 [Pseudonocardia oroxyli]|uniref:DDE superfamily endonuclease n=1 Tax=Pseudonocardia oroxyli TaxID=366584 RepID=A0A1G8D9L9_PSEOR|nr:hypothetical protein SAMN05216377_12535 [Pseudonocardia oroxyli]